MEALNLDKIICINLKSSNEQLFAISEEYGLGFDILFDMKKTFNKMWILLNGSGNPTLIRESAGRFLVFSELDNIQREAIKQIKPIKIPKIRKTPETLRLYKLYVEQGYDLYIPSLDQKLGLGKTYELVSNNNIKLDQISKSELENLMQEAVAEENYELAASLRDQINSYE